LVSLSIEPVDAQPDELAWLSALAVFGRFALAHGYGFFGMAKTPAAHLPPEIRPRLSLERPSSQVVLETALARESVIVLAGMLKHASPRGVAGAPIVRILMDGRLWDAQADGMRRLRESCHVLLEGLTPAGLKSIDLREPFSLWIKLRSPADESRREWLSQGFDLWCDLLAGGLPPHGMTPGQSAVGAASGFLCEPSVFQFSCAGVSADSMAIDFLAEFFRQGWSWADIVSIESTLN
jgi:hypothetical protein